MVSFLIMLLPIPVGFLTLQSASLDSGRPISILWFQIVVTIGCCLFGGIRLFRGLKGGTMDLMMGIIVGIVFVFIDLIVTVFSACCFAANR